MLLRQGDVLLRKVAAPTGEKTIADKVVALGEHSGHAHKITGDAEVFRIGDQLFVCVNGEGAKMEHLHLETNALADHQPLELEKDCWYEVIYQNQYNPYSKLMEKVQD